MIGSLSVQLCMRPITRPRFVFSGLSPLILSLSVVHDTILLKLFGQGLVDEPGRPSFCFLVSRVRQALLGEIYYKYS